MFASLAQRWKLDCCRVCCQVRLSSPVARQRSPGRGAPVATEKRYENHVRSQYVFGNVVTPSLATLAITLCSILGSDGCRHVYDEQALPGVLGIGRRVSSPFGTDGDMYTLYGFLHTIDFFGGDSELTKRMLVIPNEVGPPLRTPGPEVSVQMLLLEST